jgi:DNA-binding transcriptional regulator YiaG
MKKISNAERRRRAKEYRAAIAALDLNQTSAAHFLDMTSRTSRRWARGEDLPDVPAMMLLRVMINLGISVEEVDKILGREGRE